VLNRRGLWGNRVMKHCREELGGEEVLFVVPAAPADPGGFPPDLGIIALTPTRLLWFASRRGRLTDHPTRVLGGWRVEDVADLKLGRAKLLGSIAPLTITLADGTQVALEVHLDHFPTYLTKRWKRLRAARG